MLIYSGRPTALFWALLWAFVYFTVQLCLCFKAKSPVVKNIPAVTAAAFIFFGLFIHLGVFGSSSAEQVIAVIIIGFSIISALGLLLGWAVYWIYLLLKKGR